MVLPQHPLQHQQRSTNPRAINGSPKYVRHPQQVAQAAPVHPEPNMAKLRRRAPPTKHIRSEQAIK